MLADSFGYLLVSTNIISLYLVSSILFRPILARRIWIHRFRVSAPEVQSCYQGANINSVSKGHHCLLSSITLHSEFKFKFKFSHLCSLISATTSSNHNIKSETRMTVSENDIISCEFYSDLSLFWPIPDETWSALLRGQRQGIDGKNR